MVAIMESAPLFHTLAEVQGGLITQDIGWNKEVRVNIILKDRQQPYTCIENTQFVDYNTNKGLLMMVVTQI